MDGRTGKGYPVTALIIMIAYSTASNFYVEPASEEYAIFLFLIGNFFRNLVLILVLDNPEKILLLEMDGFSLFKSWIL